MIHHKLIQIILFVSGTLFLGLGILGIIIPLLPTTPFLLLSAACYAKSSNRLYNWLLKNKWFGKFIKNYRDGKGIPLKFKVLAISFLWITILLSSIFVVNNLVFKILLLIIASIVTIHIILIRPKKGVQQ